MNNRLLAVLPLLAVAACSRVEPGHVGVMVNKYGSSAGVQDKPLGVGRYWTGFSSDIYEYPIYTQTYTWRNAAKDQNADDDKKGQETSAGSNEEFSFQDKTGLSVEGDVAVSYHADPALVPKLFQHYRRDITEILTGPLRNSIRSALSERASHMTVEEIYGAQKTTLLNGALSDVRKIFAEQGLIIDSLYWASSIRLPQNILDQINAKVANEQQALAAQANVATVEARGRSQVAQAEADAKARTINAQAEAESIKIRSAALSNNPGVAQLEWIKKWNGEMPSTVYCSAGIPCVQGLGK